MILRNCKASASEQAGPHSTDESPLGCGLAACAPTRPATRDLQQGPSGGRGPSAIGARLNSPMYMYGRPRCAGRLCAVLKHATSRRRLPLPRAPARDGPAAFVAVTLLCGTSTFHTALIRPKQAAAAYTDRFYIHRPYCPQTLPQCSIAMINLSQGPAVCLPSSWTCTEIRCRCIV